MWRKHLSTFHIPSDRLAQWRKHLLILLIVLAYSNHEDSPDETLLQPCWVNLCSRNTAVKMCSLPKSLKRNCYLLYSKVLFTRGFWIQINLNTFVFTVYSCSLCLFICTSHKCPSAASPNPWRALKLCSDPEKPDLGLKPKVDRVKLSVDIYDYKDKDEQKVPYIHLCVYSGFSLCAVDFADVELQLLDVWPFLHFFQMILVQIKPIIRKH